MRSFLLYQDNKLVFDGNATEFRRAISGANRYSFQLKAVNVVGPSQFSSAYDVFIPPPPDEEIDGGYWRSGELFSLFADWKFHRCEEILFDCRSGGVPHQHAMDILLAEKIV